MRSFNVRVYMHATRTGLKKCLEALLLLLTAVSLQAGDAAEPGASACRTCHPKETAHYLASSMGRSIEQPLHSVGGGKVHHSQSGSILTANWQNGQMVHNLAEDGMTAHYPIQYQIGAGKVGYSYIHVHDGFLLQSPISYYRSFGWDVSPGYQSKEVLDFDRVLNNRCLFCHSNSVLSAGDRLPSDNRLSAIGCNRCHGSAIEHLRHPAANTIVNPAKVAATVRDGICEQCHLEGVARITNPGKSLLDFTPGKRLEDTLAIYFPADEQGSGHAAVSEVEQFAVSRCKRASGGKLWCGTCHDAHGDGGDLRTQVKAVCVGCHPRLSAASHPPGKKECTSCHMPRLTPSDVAHAATTDHRILAKTSRMEPADDLAPMQIRAWREPPAEWMARDQALAQLRSAADPRYGHLGPPAAQTLLQLASKPLAQDGAVWSALGSVQLAASQPGEAVTFFRRACSADPGNAQYALYLGIAARKAGYFDEAGQALRRSIELNASLEEAYVELSTLDAMTGKSEQAADVLDEYLRWNKQSVSGRMAKDGVGVDFNSKPPLVK